MVREKGITGKLREEFGFLRNENILAVLLFGSLAKEEIGPRDIDICVIAPNTNAKQIMKKIWQKVDVAAKKYDVYCFEELPLYIRWEIIDNHKIIWAKNEGELYEYFYYFRKLYEDQKHRMQISKEDILKMLHTSKSYS